MTQVANNESSDRDERKRKEQRKQQKHCLLTLLVEMEEHADGDTRRNWPNVELLAPTGGCFLLASHPPSIEGQKIGLLLVGDVCH